MAKMNTPRPMAHQQVMTKPSPSTTGKVSVTSPMAKAPMGSSGTTKIPGAKVNSPGIKGVKGC